MEGEEYTLTATIENAPEGTRATFTSDNDGVAHVTPVQGKITARAEGTATITATITVDGVDYTDTCTVTVAGGGGDVSITLSENSITIHPFSSTTIHAYAEPAGASVSWQTSDSTIATIDPGEDGECIVGSTEQVGSATITATATVGGSSATATCDISVIPEISLSYYNVMLTGSDQNVTVTTVPAGLPYTLTSADTSVVSVSGDQLHAESAGTTSIIASMDYEGTSYSMSGEITVSDTPFVNMVDDSVTALVTENYYPYANTCPSGQNVSYTSSEDTVLAWNSEMSCFEALAPGTATVTASMDYEGTDYTDTCTVTVISE